MKLAPCVLASLALTAFAAEPQWQVLGIGGGGGVFHPRRIALRPRPDADVVRHERQLPLARRRQALGDDPLEPAPLVARLPPALQARYGIYWASGPELKREQGQGQDLGGRRSGREALGQRRHHPHRGRPEQPHPLRRHRHRAVALPRPRQGLVTNASRASAMPWLPRTAPSSPPIDLKYFASHDDGATWKQQDVRLEKGNDIQTVGGGFQAMAGTNGLFGLVFKVGVLKSDSVGSRWTLVDQFRDCNDISCAPASGGLRSPGGAEGRAGRVAHPRRREDVGELLPHVRAEGPTSSGRGCRPRSAGVASRPSASASGPIDPKVAMVTHPGRHLHHPRRRRFVAAGDEHAHRHSARRRPATLRLRTASRSTTCWEYSSTRSSGTAATSPTPTSASPARSTPTRPGAGRPRAARGRTPSTTWSSTRP